MGLRQTPPYRVGMVLETPFPPDARVEREALALIEAGYEVHLLCGHGEHTQPDEEIYRGIHIHRVDPKNVHAEWKTPLFRFRTRFPYRGVVRNVVRHMTGTETQWKALIQRFVKDQRIDVLHVHDLRLLKTALDALKSEATIRVVSDLHENYPALVGHLTRLRKGEARGRQTQQWWEKLERQNLPRVHKVIVVVEEARDRLLKSVSVKPEDIGIVRNVVDAEKFLSAQPTPLTPEEHQRLAGKYVLCYAGFINAPHRGIETVLQALPELKKIIPNIYFVGVGSLRETYYQQRLKPLMDSLNLHDDVYFTGYRTETDFIPYIQQAHIGVCPHVKTVLTDTTFPNKVFLYSLFEKPSLVSSCEPLARYVNETDCGLVFTSEDPQDFARQVIALYQNPEQARMLGEKGKRWVVDRYSWDHEKQYLLDTYAGLQG